MNAKKTEEQITATSIFLLENITLKKDSLWRMKLLLKTQLPQTWREYKVRLSVNEEPFERRIEDLKRKKRNIEDENQLFEGSKKQTLKTIDRQVEEVEAELVDLKAELPVIEYPATIEALAYKDGDTIITLMFPATSVEAMNAQRNRFADYKIELIRE